MSFSGSQYLSNGNQDSLWSEATKTQYDKQARCFADQIGNVTYGPYEVGTTDMSVSVTGEIPPSLTDINSSPPNKMAAILADDISNAFF